LEGRILLRPSSGLDLSPLIQTGPEGQLVRKVLIEETASIARESVAPSLQPR